MRVLSRELLPRAASYKSVSTNLKCAYIMTAFFLGMENSLIILELQPSLRDRSISIGGGGPEHRGGGSPRFQTSQWGGSGYFEPHKGVGHHILSLCTLKYCKLPKPSVSLGARKSLQNLHKTCRERPFEQTEPYKLNLEVCSSTCLGQFSRHSSSIIIY